MQENNHSSRNLLIAVAILIAVGVAGYMYIGRDTTSDSDLLIGITTASSTGSVDGDLLSALRELKTISLDDTIFADPVFRSLKDFSTKLAAQPAGRANPFAPIDGSVTFTSTVTATSTR